MTKVKLEPFYYGIVVQYIDSIYTLQRFHMVSKKVNTGIEQTNINPLCGIESLQTAFSANQTQIHKIENKIFSHVDTFQVHFRYVEKMSDEELKSHKLIDVYKYVMKNNQNECQLLLNNRDMIRTIGIDTSYPIYFNLSTMKSLRYLRVRISNEQNQQVINDIINAIQFNHSIKKVIIECHSLFIPRLINEILPYQSVNKEIICIITRYSEEDMDMIKQLIKKSLCVVGIKDTHLKVFDEMFLDYKNIVILPNVPKYFRVTKEFKEHDKYPELKRLYFPVKEETMN